MFAVFKYTYKKLLFTFSTILFMSLVIFIFAMINRFEDMSNYVLWKSQVIRSLFEGSVSNFQSFFIWFILPPFVAAKSTGFIVDELEDGTFLTVLSKPVSRTKIIISKFAALLTVNATFIFAMLCITWWLGLRSNATRITTEFFIQSITPMFIIPFVLSTVLSVILVILSLKIKSSLIIGLGTGVGFFSFVGPSLINNLVIKNVRYQQSIGRVVEKAGYDIVNNGQRQYSKFKYLNYTQHANQIFYENIAKTLSKYDLDSLALTQINKEIIFADYNVKEKNKLGKDVIVKKFKVKENKNWIPTRTLYSMYSILTILFLFFGIMYFNRKDIV